MNAVFDIVDEKFKQSTEGDRKFRSDLMWLVNEMHGVGGATLAATLDGKPLHVLIEAAAVACGMKLEGAATKHQEQIHHPNAPAKSGKLRVVKFLRLYRFLHDMVDDWKLYSARLGYSVCTAEWQRLHASSAMPLDLTTAIELSPTERSNLEP